MRAGATKPKIVVAHVDREEAGAPVELTILMPCLNEAETLTACIAKAHRYLSEHAVSGEVLIADNGSTDGSQRIAEENGARVVDIPQRGYGAALIAGVKEARGRYVIMGDADDSYDFSNLSGMLDQLRGGSQLVMGDRFAGGILTGAMPPLHQYLGNPVLSFLGRLFFHSAVHDFHCGLRGFDTRAVLALGLQTTGMEFASELVVKASLADYRISEVPVVLHPDGRSRPPHLRSWRDGWRHLRFLLLYSPRWLFYYPGGGLAVVGLLSMILLAAHVWWPGQGRLPDGLLVAAGGLVIVGFQALQFALFARFFEATHGLLPPPRQQVSRTLDRVSFEMGAVAGGFLVLLSTATLAVTLVLSRASNADSLSASLAFRLGVCGVVAGVLGVQCMLGGAFLSILRLSPQRHQAAEVHSMLGESGNSAT